MLLSRFLDIGIEKAFRADSATVSNRKQALRVKLKHFFCFHFRNRYSVAGVTSLCTTYVLKKLIRYFVNGTARHFRLFCFHVFILSSQNFTTGLWLTQSVSVIRVAVECSCNVLKQNQGVT